MQNVAGAIDEYRDNQLFEFLNREEEEEFETCECCHERAEIKNLIDGVMQSEEILCFSCRSENMKSFGGIKNYREECKIWGVELCS